MTVMSETTDAILEKGKEIADMTCQKGMELVERAKIGVKIRETKAKLKSGYEQLGRITYNYMKNDLDDDAFQLKAKFASLEIDGLVERMNLLNRELGEVKGAVVCPQCGAINPEKAKYCTECASAINGK